MTSSTRGSASLIVNCTYSLRILELPADFLLAWRMARRILHVLVSLWARHPTETRGSSIARQEPLSLGHRFETAQLVRVVGTIEHVDPVTLEETFQVCLEKATRPYLHFGRDGALK